MKTICTIFILLTLSLVRCNEPPHEASTVHKIDVLTKNEKLLFLSEFVNCISYIPLDIPSKYKIQGEPFIYLSKKYIFYTALFKDENSIFPYTACLIFNRKNSHFITALEENKINTPVILNKVNITLRRENSFFIDDKNEDVFYISGYKKNDKGIFSSCILAYNIKTKAMKELLSLDNNTFSFAYIENGLFLVYQFNINGNTENKISIYNSYGEILHKVAHGRFFKQLNPYAGTYIDDFNFYTKNNKYYYYDSHIDTIYSIDKKMKIEPVHIFNLDTLSSPYYYEASTRNSELQLNKYIKISSVHEYGNYVFFKYCRNSNYYYNLFNIEKNCVIRVLDSISSRGKLLNDVDGGIAIWPQSINKDGEFVDFAFSDTLKLHLRNTCKVKIKDSIANSELRILANKTDNNNPIIIIAKLKGQ